MKQPASVTEHPANVSASVAKQPASVTASVAKQPAHINFSAIAQPRVDPDARFCVLFRGAATSTEYESTQQQETATYWGDLCRRGQLPVQPELPDC